MTKFQKQMLTIAAAGALTAVTALPAMAFENEFHGIYNFNTVFSNFNTGASGDFKPNQATWGDSRKMNNYMEQRARIQYVAKASDDLKLVTHFEMNTRFGSAANGGRLDTDVTNIVTKHAYLDFNIGKNFNTVVGLLPYKDTLKGLFIDADAPAIYTTTKMGAYTLGLGFSRFAADDGTPLSTTTTRIGDANKDLFIMDNTLTFNKDTKVALSYYLLADYANTYAANTTAANSSAALWQLNPPVGGGTNQRTILHTLGLSGETKLGDLSLSGFAAMQAGVHTWAPGTVQTTSTNFHGWAANVAAKMKVGSGTAKTAFLFTSGNNSTNAAQFNGWVSSSVNSYNEGGMMILARNTGNSPTSTDQYIRRDVTNIALLTMGYDANLTDKLSLNTNVGFAWAPATASMYAAYDNGAPVDPKMGTSRNGSDFMGAEINLETGYQLYKNLKVMAQAGYMLLGGYYKNSTYKNGAAATAPNAVDPENPYTMRLQARYSF